MFHTLKSIQNSRTCTLLITNFKNYNITNISVILCLSLPDGISLRLCLSPTPEVTTILNLFSTMKKRPSPVLGLVQWTLEGIVQGLAMNNVLQLLGLHCVENLRLWVPSWHCWSSCGHLVWVIRMWRVLRAGHFNLMGNNFGGSFCLRISLWEWPSWLVNRLPRLTSL